MPYISDAEYARYVQGQQPKPLLSSKDVQAAGLGALIGSAATGWSGAGAGYGALAGLGASKFGLVGGVEPDVYVEGQIAGGDDHFDFAAGADELLSGGARDDVLVGGKSRRSRSRSRKTSRKMRKFAREFSRSYSKCRSKQTMYPSAFGDAIKIRQRAICQKEAARKALKSLRKSRSMAGGKYACDSKSRGMYGGSPCAYGGSRSRRMQGGYDSAFSGRRMSPTRMTASTSRMAASPIRRTASPSRMAASPYRMYGGKIAAGSAASFSAGSTCKVCNGAWRKMKGGYSCGCGPRKY